MAAFSYSIYEKLGISSSKAMGRMPFTFSIETPIFPSTVISMKTLLNILFILS
jgi:hypothetical protein